MCTEQYDITVDDLNPTFLFTCKVARICDEKNYHCHDHIEVAIILSGKGEYYIDGVTYFVESGDVIVLNPGVYHKGLVSDFGNPALEYFVGFTDIHFRNMKHNCIELKNGGPILRTSGELRRKIFQTCTLMSEEQEYLHAGRYFMLKTYLIQLLLYMVREQIEPVREQQGYSFESFGKKYVVEQIVGYLEEHYSEKISLDRIAENMYLSPFYISKIFKSETGDTPINYLIHVRLEKAREMLESGENNSIQGVAAKVGYDDAYHFSKLFKKRYGVSPSQMRRID